MTKQKYNISPEGMDKLMEKLTAIAIEPENEEAVGLLEAEITSDFAKRMLKVKDLDDVIERNEQLSKSMFGFLNMYGFDTAHDMYIYSLSCDLYPIKKSKDYSKLVPVKRKIIRNGKETEVTVYEDPNKDNKDEDDKNSKSSGSGQRVGHARELPAKRHSRKSKKTGLNPKNVAKLKSASKSFRGQAFKDSSHHYLEINGPDGEVVGVIGYSEEGEYMVMDFYRSNGQIQGIATRGFAELIKLAREEHKGVKVKDDVQARPVYVKFGLQQDGETWSITYDELNATMGEGVAPTNE
jgi:hypothetical protein